MPDPPTGPEETASTADTAQSTVPTGETGDSGTAPTTGRSYRKLSAGELLTCGLFDDGEITCIGSTPWSVPAAPSGPFVDVVASWDTACGVREGGELACWGCDWVAELCEAPGGSDWVAIDAARDFFCAQNQAGGVSCWNYGGPLTPPYGPDPDELWSSYAVGITGFVGIRASDGRAEGIGEGQAPPGVLVDIAAGQSSACGVRASDATASCVNHEGPPLPDSLAQIDSYERNYCWLDTEGHVGCTRRGPDAARDGFDPETEVFASMSVGHDHACAVTTDGRGFCWPRDGRPETSGIPERPAEAEAP